MGGFGEHVSALLDTYTRCLGLLKAFKGHGGSSDTSPYDPAVSRATARLRGSIRSDRSQIRKAYSSKLSKSGNKLERGDAPSKAAIRRILDRLKAAIINLLSMVKTQKPALDYESLMSLSNASRVDAIRTMEQLSLRLSSSSSLFHEHRRPISGISKSSSSSSSSGKKTRRQPSRDTHSNAPGEGSRSRRHAAAASYDHGPVGEISRQKSPRERPHDSRAHHSRQSRSRSSNEDPERRYDQHRISYMTMSSDSTKLGEIPHRRSRLVCSSDSSQADGYNVRPVYPLHTYTPPAPTPKVKRGFLKRVFGGRTRQEDY